MMKKSLSISILIISIVFILTNLATFAYTSVQSNSVVLSSCNFINGNLAFEGQSTSDILKLKLVKAETEVWYDVELFNGHFNKSIYLIDDTGIYDVYFMVHEGGYNFVDGLHYKLNTISSSISDMNLQNKSALVTNKYQDTKELSNYNSDNKDYQNTMEIANYNNANRYENTMESSRNNKDIKLYSVNNASFNEDVNKYFDTSNMSIRDIANMITANGDTDYEKANAIYKWVSENIVYDMKKYRSLLNNDYNYDYGAMYAIRNGKGICYDFASLTSEIAKEAGLNAKLIRGDYIMNNGHREYHAWNEIFIMEAEKWISLDTTFASVYRKNYFNNNDFNSNHEKIEEE